MTCANSIPVGKMTAGHCVCNHPVFKIVGQTYMEAVKATGEVGAHRHHLVAPPY